MFSAPRGETQAKLLLLYMLERFALPMYEQQALRLVSELGYMNYFDFKQYIGELVEAGLVEPVHEGERKAYVLTEPAGRKALESLQRKLPQLLRSGVDEYLALKRGELNAEMRTEARISGEGDDLSVTMRVWESGNKLIELTLPAAGPEQARLIVTRWYAAAGDILKYLSATLNSL